MSTPDTNSTGVATLLIPGKQNGFSHTESSLLTRARRAPPAVGNHLITEMQLSMSKWHMQKEEGAVVVQ